MQRAAQLGAAGAQPFAVTNPRAAEPRTHARARIYVRMGVPWARERVP